MPPAIAAALIGCLLGAPSAGAQDTQETPAPDLAAQVPSPAQIPVQLPAVSEPAAAVPDAPTAPTADDVQKALEARRSQLNDTKTWAGTIEKDMVALAVEREKINAQLVETAATVQRSEARMTAIEDRLGGLEAQEKLVRGSLSQRHDQIAKLLAALQRMGRNPPPVIMTKREDALAMVRSAMLLASAFPGMRTQALSLGETLDNLLRVMSDIRAEGDKLRDETANLNVMRTKLSGLMETKRQSITERQAELQTVRLAAAEISKTVTDLNELISKLDQTVSKNTGLEAYNAQTAAVSTTPADPALAGGPPVSPAIPLGPGSSAEGSTPSNTSKPDTRVVELAPGEGLRAPGNTGRIRPAVAFDLAKAKLPLPVQGRRVLAFGEKTQYGGTSKGLVIETRSNAQVTSPCDGWIVYAGEFRSYGKLLIINAGGGYHVLVAGLSQIDAQPGQFVLAAEPVGTMSSVPKQEQAGAPANAPVLYIEFRKDGQPINPDPWWVESLQKAQG